MSEVDNRIVKLGFDNKDFEKAIRAIYDAFVE